VNIERFSVALTCWVLMLAAPAFAQGVAGGLFGATRADSGVRDKLDVQLSMSQAFDSEMPPEFRSLQPSDLQSGGRSTVLLASADYARNRRSVQLFGNASTYFRYAQSLDRIGTGSQSGHLGASVRLPNQGTLRITQSAAYSPFYLYELFPTSAPLAPGEAVPVNPEYQINQTDSYSYRTGMSLELGSVRGTRFTTTADYRVTDFGQQQVARPNLANYAAGARLSRALSRRTSLSAGYEYRVGEFESNGLTKEHRATMGVEYSPPLSVTRRMVFRLEVSPSLVETHASIPAAVATRTVERRLSPLQGEAAVDYPFRLKWRASASYRRDVNYVPGLTEPVFTTGGRISVTGLIGRRVDVSAFAASATGTSPTSLNTRNFASYTGEARIRYALTRTFALYSEYLYYYYDLGGQAHLAPGLPAVYEQRGIRVGFMLLGQPLGR
jgi:hypothetical protein